MRTDDEWLKEHFELTFPKLHNNSYEIPGDHPLLVTLNRGRDECDPDSEIFGWNVSCDARLYARPRRPADGRLRRRRHLRGARRGREDRVVEVIEAAKGPHRWAG